MEEKEGPVLRDGSEQKVNITRQGPFGRVDLSVIVMMGQRRLDAGTGLQSTCCLG